MTASTFEVREDPATFRFTFDQFERMFHDGYFERAGGRVELLEGRVVEMAPIGAEHGDVTADLTIELGNATRSLDEPSDLRVTTGVTLRIDADSAPEPDIMVVQRRAVGKYYEAADALLVVEISVSTRPDDLRIKRPLYARAGVPELWIVEPEQRRVRVFRGPVGDGTWDSEAVVSDGDLTPLFSDRVRIALSNLF